MSPDDSARSKAFISHSSADKERIARPLDALLRDRGIEVWLDERDLLPGRNLIDEIFEQGIAASDAFICILSANTIDSKWVHEELTNAIVQKIDGAVKIIIPVVLDGVTPPAALKHTVWEPISDLSRLPIHADRIAAAIIGMQPAPVSTAPAYAGIPIHGLPKLTADDERLFVSGCKQLFEGDFYYPLVSFEQLFQYGQSIGMSEEQIEESLAALEQHYYFSDVLHSLGARHGIAGRVTQPGFEAFLVNYMPVEYRKAKLDVVANIVNEDGHSSRMITQVLNIPEAIVCHILVALEKSDHVIASHHSEGISIRPNPTLRRVLRNLESDPDSHL